MSKIHPAIKLVIPGRIRRLFREGRFSRESWAIELLMGSACSKPAPYFKFLIINEIRQFPKITSTKSVKYICQSRIEENF